MEAIFFNIRRSRGLSAECHYYFSVRVVKSNHGIQSQRDVCAERRLETGWRMKTFGHFQAAILPVERFNGIAS